MTRSAKIKPLEKLNIDLPVIEFTAAPPLVYEGLKVFGTAKNDFLLGRWGVDSPDTILGFGGNDVIDGGRGIVQYVQSAIDA